MECDICHKVTPNIYSFVLIRLTGGMQSVKFENVEHICKECLSAGIAHARNIQTIGEQLDSLDIKVPKKSRKKT
jgi:repressor of nif and glnA expression